MTLAQNTKSWLNSLPGAVTLIALYCLAHMALRLSTSVNIGENDPQIILSIQDGLRWSYSTGEPPLFEWLAYLFAEIFGPTALIFQFLRYSFLALALVFVFLIARHISGSSLWALLTVESYALIYQVSWRMHEGFTHPIIAIAAVTGVFYAFLRLRDHLSLFNIALFFVFLAMGLLSNIWFYGFLAAFLIAIATESSARALLFKPLIMLAIIGAIGLAWPYWQVDSRFWNAPGWLLFTTPEGLLASEVSARLSGFFTGLTRPLLFVSPLLPLLILFFWPSLWKTRFYLLSCEPAEDKCDRRRVDDLRLLWATTAIAVLGLVVLGITNGYTEYSEHAVMPLFFLAPIGLMALVQRSNPARKQQHYFLILCILVLAGTFSSRAANLVILDPICSRCYFGIPFDGLAQHIADDREVGAVLTFHRRIGGNLRAHIREDQRVYDIGWPSLATPQAGDGAMIVAPDEASIDGYVSSAQRRYRFEQSGAARLVSVPWTHAFRQDGYRVSEWYVVPGTIGPTNQ
ncbi:MAG: ArnT family glycosyltransferase [Devosiaceae bacterium]